VSQRAQVCLCVNMYVLCRARIHVPYPADLAGLASLPWRGGTIVLLVVVFALCCGQPGARKDRFCWECVGVAATSRQFVLSRQVRNHGYYWICVKLSMCASESHTPNPPSRHPRHLDKCCRFRQWTVGKTENVNLFFHCDTRWAP
jgi:hypothetical protein